MFLYTRQQVCDFQNIVNNNVLKRFKKRILDYMYSICKPSFFFISVLFIFRFWCDFATLLHTFIVSFFVPPSLFIIFGQNLIFHHFLPIFENSSFSVRYLIFASIFAGKWKQKSILINFPYFGFIVYNLYKFSIFLKKKNLQKRLVKNEIDQNNLVHTSL